MFDYVIEKVIFNVFKKFDLNPVLLIVHHKQCLRLYTSDNSDKLRYLTHAQSETFFTI